MPNYAKYAVNIKVDNINIVYYTILILYTILYTVILYIFLEKKKGSVGFYVEH